MNNIYRIVWSAVTGRWIVASELAKGRKKKASKISLAAAVAALSMAAGGVHAQHYTAGVGAQVTGSGGSGSTGCNWLVSPQYQALCSATNYFANGTAVGTAATAAGSGTAFGDHATTDGVIGTALGTFSYSDTHGTAVGAGATAQGDSAVAVGYNAITAAQGAVAVGNAAKGTAQFATALGAGTSAVGTKGATAVGWNASADSGTASGAWSATTVGTNSIAAGDGATAFGDSAHAQGDRAAAFGRAANATANQATAFGASTKASAAGSTAIGYNAQATGANSTAIGANSNTNRANTVSVGSVGGERNVINVAAGVANTDAVNVSQLKPVVAGLGGGASIDPITGAVTGPTYNVQGGTQTNVGDALNALDGSVNNRVAYDKNADGSTNYNSVTLGNGHASGPAALHNVAAGKADTDAVNVSQLKNTAQSAAAALGGGAAVSADGTITAPSYTVADLDNGGSKTAGNVGDALGQLSANTTNLDGRVTQNTGDIASLSNQIGNGSIGLVQQAKAGADLTVGKDTDGVRVDFADKDGNTRTLANVSAGSADTDAVNFSQLKGTAQSAATALGGGAAVGADGTITAPSYTVADLDNGGSKTVGNVGDALGQLSANTTNLDGRVSKNTGDLVDIRNQIGNGSIGLVQQSAPNAAVTVAAGTGGTAVNFTGTDGARQLKGVDSGVDATDAVNVRQLNQAIADVSAGSTRYFKANGENNGTDDAAADGDYAVAVGAGAQGTGAGAVAIGHNAKATADNAVALGAGSVADRDNSVSIGSLGNERWITNVRAGMADTDAVNVGQLRGVAGALGGGAGIGADGAFVNPNYTINDVTYNNVGDALNGLAKSIGDTGDRVTIVEKVISTGDTNAHVSTSGDKANAASATGNNATAIGAGASASNNNSVALGAGSTTDRDNVVSVGSAGAERVVANVADAVYSTDAINKRTMDSAVAGAKNYTDQQIGMVQQAIGDVSRKAYAGIAGATALTMIPDVDQGKTVAAGVGVGSYQGYAASAIGVSARLSERIKVKMGASLSGSGSTYGAGASYQW